MKLFGRAKKLDDLHIEYERLLIREIESLLGHGTSHGWVSNQVEDGIRMRKRLREAGSRLPIPKEEE